MCLVDVLTKYGDDRSTFEILSPDNGIPLKNLGLTPLTPVSETIPYFMFLIYIETPDLLQNLCAAPVSTVTWWKNRISLLDVIFRLIIGDFSFRTFEIIENTRKHKNVK